MSGWMLGVENQLIDIRRAKMKYARFMMIDPDHRMKMLAHKIAPGRFGATIGRAGRGAKTSSIDVTSGKMPRGLSREGPQSSPRRLFSFAHVAPFRF
jgi:hypothetical protein